MFQGGLDSEAHLEEICGYILPNEVNEHQKES